MANLFRWHTFDVAGGFLVEVVDPRGDVLPIWFGMEAARVPGYMADVVRCAIGSRRRELDHEAELDALEVR